jgi:hypothetical protein
MMPALSYIFIYFMTMIFVCCAIDNNKYCTVLYCYVLYCSVQYTVLYVNEGLNNYNFDC